MTPLGLRLLKIVAVLAPFLMGTTSLALALQAT